MKFGILANLALCWLLDLSACFVQLNPSWENARQEILDNHFKLICAYKGNLQELVPLQGL